ncbi:Uncharacterised protein [Mycobacterium tuberculosis]|nr:Uncharacterised protein [Mycobacterium tuberculosis]
MIALISMMSATRRSASVLARINSNMATASTSTPITAV